MTLIQLLIYVGIVAVIATGILKFSTDKVKNLLGSFLQNFCGILLLVSGFVKLVDPLGTAYKMEDYFEQFELTFQETWLSFIAPVFPLMSEYSIIFSLITIVLEILLGILLITGTLPKITSWAFLLLMIFFTKLTGFTFLTGYVPSGENFFDFSAWGEFAESNMRVTDCGCFGDFIKLDPRVSFLKDLVLLIPALYFIFSWRAFHRLFTAPWRRGIAILTILAATVYGISNFVWDIPDFDFRPFSVGTDLRTQKHMETEAAANVEITDIILKNKSSNQESIVPYEQYMKEYATSYPKEEFEVVDYRKTEPTVEMSKVSEFAAFDEQGHEHGDDIFNDKGYSTMVISHKPPEGYKIQTVTESDSLFEDVKLQRTNKDTGEIDTLDKKKFIRIVENETEKDLPYYSDDLIETYKNKVNNFLHKARKDGHKIMLLQGSCGWDGIAHLAEILDIDYPIYQADDILLKTIVRSNPGIFIMKDGKVVAKYHISKLPDYDSAKSDF